MKIIEKPWTNGNCCILYTSGSANATGSAKTTYWKRNSDSMWKIFVFNSSYYEATTHNKCRSKEQNHDFRQHYQKFNSIVLSRNEIQSSNDVWYLNPRLFYIIIRMWLIWRSTEFAQVQNKYTSNCIQSKFRTKWPSKWTRFFKIFYK